VSTFLQAILDRRAVVLEYRSPYAAEAEQAIVAPDGLVWDRDRWYLAGRQALGARRIRADDDVRR
jgi:predicted DNA-binding transcriptional regulator YafY